MVVALGLQEDQLSISWERMSSVSSSSIEKTPSRTEAAAQHFSTQSTARGPSGPRQAAQHVGKVWNASRPQPCRDGGLTRWFLVAQSLVWRPSRP